MTDFYMDEDVVKHVSELDLSEEFYTEDDYGNPVVATGAEILAAEQRAQDKE